jgi:hypothetical protein
MAEASGIPLSVVVLTGCTTVVLASALAFVFWKSNKYVSSSPCFFLLCKHLSYTVGLFYRRTAAMEVVQEDEAPATIEMDRKVCMHSSERLLMTSFLHS